MGKDVSTKLLCGISIAGAVGLLAYEIWNSARYFSKQEYIRRNLEPGAVYALDYGRGFSNKDRDENGRFESYFRDSATGIEYRVRLNPQTREFTHTKVE